ncbi:MAG: DoxX family protein [Hyphomonadaceae bacterium]
MTTETRTPANRMQIAGWIVSGLIGAFLAFSASLKFFMQDIVRETMSGLGWPAQHDLMIGIIETACVVLYLVPRTAVLGAVLETGLLGGAIATNVRVDNPLFSHELFGVYLGVLVWLGLWLRDPRVRALMPLRKAQG